MNDWIEYSNLLTAFWTFTKNLWNGKYTVDKDYIEAVKQFHSKQKSTRIIEWGKLQTKDFSDSWSDLREFLFNEFRMFVVRVYQSEITISNSNKSS